MDIDGTLVTSNHATFDHVSAQLRRLKPLNVRFSVATGRTIAGSRPVLERLQATVGMRMPPAINYNGAVLLSPRDGSLVERHVLDPASVAAAVRACRARGLWPLVYACHDIVAAAPLETVYLDSAAPPAAEFNGMQTKRIADAGEVDSDVVAVLADAGDVAASARIAAELATELGPRLRATTSGSRYVEICAPGANKSAAVERLASLHQITVAEVMAIGDNLNDLEMIRIAGVGVAVGNAPAEVKAVADYACSRDSGEGVVEALRMLVRVLHLRTHTRRGANDCATPRRAHRDLPTTALLTAF
jgi:Cof subfamily protein (haloacid dehalogenase superfamily)